MKKNKDIIVIGFASFGAGNLISPFIGMTSGSNWLTSFIFVLADVGIILLSINAVAKSGF